MAVPKDRPVVLGAVAVLTASGLMLAGCSGDSGGEGTTPAPSSTSASPSATVGGDGDGSASPSASASGSPSGEYEPATSEGPAQNVPVPEMPEAATEPTEEGVEAALEYWWEAAYLLQLTGDAELFEAMSSSDCILCASYVDNWQEIYESGGWSTGSEADIPDSFVSVEEAGDTATLLFKTVEAPSSLYSGPDEEVSPEESDLTFTTNWSGTAVFDPDEGHWVIDELVAEGEPIAE